MGRLDYLCDSLLLFLSVYFLDSELPINETEETLLNNAEKYETNTIWNRKEQSNAENQSIKALLTFRGKYDKICNDVDTNKLCDGIANQLQTKGFGSQSVERCRQKFAN